MTQHSQLSYASGPSDAPLLGQTIDFNFEQTRKAFPDREALVDVPTDRRWTFDALGIAIDEFAAGLIEYGVQRGDRVGIWAPNCAEWVITQYATARIGAILVNINPAYRSQELDYVLRDSAVRLLVSAASFRSNDCRAMLAEIGFNDTVFIGEESWDAVVEAGRRAGVDAARRCSAQLDFDDPINIQYTSGTTGFPKGATLTHHNVLNNAYFVGGGVHYTEDDRVCLPVPLYHCFGMVMGVLGAHSHGACVVLPAPGFDPESTLQAVQSERCTSLYGVPSMFIAELELPRFADYDLSSLRTGIMAGSPCPVEIMKRVVSEMHMSEVAICYGMTETSPVSTMTRSDDDLEHRTQTVGRVMPHVEVKIVDPDTQMIVPAGSPGELCTRGYSVMRGYWNNPDKTKEAIDSSGWMHTGDLASIDEDGYLQIVGRLKDVVIRGGENIYPREIEEFLYAHPDIADVQVIGVPDERYGEELMAWIVLRPGARSLEHADLRAFCEGRLAGYKIPRYVHLVESFPMTVTGKVRKIEMREAAAAILSTNS
jgi:fatty-acyl-CoA synthase